MAKMNSVPVEQQGALTLNPRLGGPPSSKRTLAVVVGLLVAREGSTAASWLSTCEDWDGPGTGTLLPDLLPQGHPAPAASEGCKGQLGRTPPCRKHARRTQARPSSKAILGLDFSPLLQVDFSLPWGEGMDSILLG